MRMTGGASMALLCQQCTTGRVQSFNINREWRPTKRFKPVFIRATAASSSSSSATQEQDEPTIDELLTKLEQGSSTSSPPPQAQAQQRRVPTPRGGRTFSVPDEDLVVDKVLSGRVKSIMTFGAFIDMGARVDGLLHISKLGEGFVKSVEDVLSVGQELQVQIIEADLVNRRVKLKRYDPNPTPKPAAESARTSSPGPGAPSRERGKIAGRSSPPRRSEQANKSSYQKGQAVTGVVKNLTRRGCFVELPGGEEGFMHANEISAGGENAPIESLIKVGQEVKIKVLRIVEGRLNLTMKEELDLKKVNEELNVTSLLATNAFELAFRKNAAIRKYLEESGKLPSSTASQELETTAAVAEGDKEEDLPSSTVAQELETTEEDKVEDLPSSTVAQELETTEEDKVEDLPISTVAQELETEKDKVEDLPSSTVSETTAAVAEEDTVEDLPASQELETTAAVGEEDKVEDLPSSQELETVAEEDTVEDLPSSTLSQELDTTAAVAEEDRVEELVPSSSVTQGLETAAVTEDKVEETDSAADDGNDENETAAAASPEEAAQEIKAEVPEKEPETKRGTTISAALVKQLRQQSGAGMMDCKKALVETNGNFEEAVDYLRKKGLAGADKKAGRIAGEGAIGSFVEDGRIGVLLEVNCETDFVSRGELFRQLVADLGMQLAACEGQGQGEEVSAEELVEQAFIKDKSVLVKDVVRQASASVGEKIQVRRLARYILGEGRQGLVVSYVHAGRVGVLIQVECGTEVAARSGVFAELAEDLAMQVVASPQVEYVSVEDVPSETRERERAIEMEREDLMSKAEAIRGKIVEGRLRKLLSERALLEQPYLKDDALLVKELVNKTSVSLGDENIKVLRFVRYNLGEGIDKKSHNLVEEIAALSK